MTEAAVFHGFETALRRCAFHGFEHMLSERPSIREELIEKLHSDLYVGLDS